jgi:hypothetical protein
MAHNQKYQQDYYRIHEDIIAAKQRQRRRGLTPEQYNEMLADQLWGCAICGKSDSLGRRLAVDHNHITGKIRGLLCNRCNRAIGFVDESLNRLQSIANYLSEREE